MTKLKLMLCLKKECKYTSFFNNPKVFAQKNWAGVSEPEPDTKENSRFGNYFQRYDEKFHRPCETVLTCCYSAAEEGIPDGERVALGSGYLPKSIVYIEVQAGHCDRCAFQPIVHL